MREEIVYPYHLCNNREKKRWYAAKFRGEQEADYEDAWREQVWGGAEFPLVTLARSVVDWGFRMHGRKQYRARLENQAQTLQMGLS